MLSSASLEVEPMLASTMLRLEGPSSPAQLPGLPVDGLDARFRRLWRGGDVIGIGAIDQDSLALSVVASGLLSGLSLSQIASQDISNNLQSSTSSSPFTVYIVAPHTYQTIPLLHSHLANKLSDSAIAMSLLNNVQSLQFFDFAGLVESVAEINERMFQIAQKSPKSKGQGTEQTIGHSSQPRSLVLIQGLAQTIAAAQRRCGFVQANALLASLIRNITQLSRSIERPLVLIDVRVDIQKPNEPAQQEMRNFQRDIGGIQLHSAFSGPTGESFRLDCGSALSSHILEKSFDRFVLVHDAFGRAASTSREKKTYRKLMVEVIKDRVGDMTGLWAPWHVDVSK